MKTVCYLLMFILSSGVNLHGQHSNAFIWLTGTWKINTGKGIILEQWKIVNDSTLAGKSMFIQNSRDTVPQETVELAYRNGIWYFIPTVQGQNNNEPVKFKVILLKAGEFICENQAHDFPQRIAYRRLNQQLLASIEGRQNGNYNKQNFDFNLE